MLFDKFCGVAEKHLPRLRPHVANARLFLFPGKSHEVLPKSYDDEEVQFLQEHFFLPFQTIAIEDPASCLLLSDPVEGATGLGSERLWVECMSFNPDKLSNFDPKSTDMSAQQKKKFGDMPKGSLIISLGAIALQHVSNMRFEYEGGLIGTYMVVRDQLIDMSAALDGESDEVIGSALNNAGVALQEVMFFNHPKRFILEKISQSKSARKTRDKGVKIPRSHERPTYTILDPRDIRKTMGLQELVADEGKHKITPHERRRHYRTLSNDRFVNTKGKTIIVKATWVGASEATVGKNRYRVLLDV